MNKLTVEFLLEIYHRTRKIVSVSSSDPVEKAAQILKTNNIGLLLVMDHERLVGVISERDLVQRWICNSEFPKTLTVGSVMSKDVETVSTFDTIYDCYLRFVARNCRHLPVLDPMNRVVGVLSLKDVADYVVNRLREKLAEI